MLEIQRNDQEVHVGVDPQQRSLRDSKLGLIIINNFTMKQDKNS